MSYPSVSNLVLKPFWWNSRSDNVGLRMLILTIVMLTMNEGTTGAYYSVNPAFGFTNEQHELRGKKFFLSHIWKPVRFFSFRVNPKVKDLKLTFTLRTEDLFVYLDEEEKNKILLSYFLPFCTRKLLPYSVETFFISNFSHFSAPRKVSWEMANLSVLDNDTNRAACFGNGLCLPPFLVSTFSLIWDLWSPMPNLLCPISFWPCES